MLEPWRLHTYVRSDGKPDVQQDVDRLDTYGTEALAAAVRYLSVTPKADWNRPHAAKLKGHGDLYEIRFKSRRVQTRALGFFGPAPRQFTITLIATKKQNDYKPRDALTTGIRRAQELLAGKARCSPLQIDGEDVSPISD